MKGIKCYWPYIKRIAIYTFFLTLFLGTIDFIYSGGNWIINYGQTFVITVSCAFFCSLFLLKLFSFFDQLPRLVFYILFSLFVGVGIFLGVATGMLILERRLSLQPEILFFSFMVGIVFSIIISAGFVYRERLEAKIARLKEIEIENEKLRRIESEARLNGLQAKLNPHFLFNILNSTAALIYDDPVKAEKSIVRLSNLYRKVLSISNQTFIPIAEELELIEDYLELEKMRFEDKLSYHMTCSEDLKSERIPGLLIEPLVENVIKHGSAHSAAAIQIDIHITAQNGHIAIEVADSGPGFEVEKADFGFGLFSIQERLKLLFGRDYSFNIISEKDQGTRVNILIPRGEE